MLKNIAVKWYIGGLIMTLNHETEIVQSDMQEDGTVKVYIERPDEQYRFKHATILATPI